MNEMQRDLLASYLRNTEIDIYGVTYLKSGKPALDSVTVHYYEQRQDGWFLTTDEVSSSGNVATRSVKALRP